ncbi:MAG TPA: hypothetical protein VF337_02155 [Candidatus Limnocylindrales bacterium]
MSRREAWISAASVFVVALVVRAVAAAVISFPIPEDTAYYAGVARNLVQGRGLVTDALWSYGTQPLVVPRAAFEIWMPLPSLLAAIPIAIFGADNWYRAAQVFSVITSSVVVVMAWRLAADVAAEMSLPIGRARTMGIGTGLVAAIMWPLVIYGALPDSTALFAALALGACLLMTRIAVREAAVEADAAKDRGRKTFDRRLLAIGVVLGLTALTRSEAIWLALTWAVVAWFCTPGGRRHRLGLIAVPAAISAVIFMPWAVRNWLTFGTPLPGQTIANALYVRSLDVFSYQDQPTLGRYLAQGPAAILGAHVDGFAHNLLNTLMLSAFPLSLLGIVALFWVGRRRALRPVVLVSAFTFLFTSLVFPVATQSGTFLHSAGPAFVLLAIAGVVALDAVISRAGRWRHWTRPVAWLGPAFAIAALAPLCFVTVTTLGRQADDARVRYEVLPAAMARAGVPLDGTHPVITDNPIWLAETAGVPTLSLPEESPDAILALANHFGAQLLVVRDETKRAWPDILLRGGAASKCFQEVLLTDNFGKKPEIGSPLFAIHVFRIVCA